MNYGKKVHLMGKSFFFKNLRKMWDEDCIKM